MNKLRTNRAFIPAFFATFLLVASVEGKPPLQYVDPIIGTGFGTTPSALRFSKGTENHIQTVPMVCAPNAMTNWTPQTRNTEVKCVAPYYYADSLIQGFRASHWINGGCVADYGTFTIMPVSGDLTHRATERGSAFSHNKEVVTPAFYSVYLDRYGVEAQMTAGERCAIFKFRYDNDGNRYVVVEVNSDYGRGYVKIDPERREISGFNPINGQYRLSQLSVGFSGYFVVKFDADFEEFGTFSMSGVEAGRVEAKGHKELGAYVRFKSTSNKEVTAKAATSFTSIDGAQRNLYAEVSDRDFNALRAKTEGSWDKVLSKIKLDGASDEQKTIFYTALYHSMLLPRMRNDADGLYPKFSNGAAMVQSPQGSNNYDDFSMWDVYRATLPLYTIIESKKTSDFVNSLVSKYEEGGWLPIFPIAGSYTSAMIGDHAIAFICDAWVKGIGGFDVSKAYEAMRQNAFETPEAAQYKLCKGRRALESYTKYGYIPLEDPVSEAFHRKEQVSRTLEYAYDDFALSQMAKALGKTDDYKVLIGRASNWKNVFDPKTKWVRGRYADGRFIEQFNPSVKESFITEGTPRHYTWYVPHDIAGLMSAMGKEHFISSLDSMFSDDYYWHGNEPGHQIPFMYNWAGVPWKTQQRVRQIMIDEYGLGSGGLCGNEDGGQLSSWYLFASMGFYPVCPSTPHYAIASPSFPKVVISLENGKKFTIIANNASAENIYIQSATMNGQSYDKSYITHDDIVGGATMVFEMGAKPNKKWASTPQSAPYSLSGL